MNSIKLFNHYIQKHDVSFNGVREIVSKLTKEQQIELLLFCAKNCFHLNTENTKKTAKKCIDLAESWLYSENKPTKEELISAANVNVSIHSTVSCAYYAVNAATGTAYAIHVAISPYNPSIDFYITNSVVNAAYAENQDYRKKLQHYLNAAKSYLTSTNFKPEIPFFDKKEIDKMDLHGFFDYLEDSQIEIFEKYNENLVLNLSGYKLAANNVSEMIDKIIKDMNVINQLKRMFNHK